MIQNVQFTPVHYAIMQDVKVKKEKKNEPKVDTRYIIPVSGTEKGKTIDLKA